MLLIYFLIVLFTILILYQLFSRVSNNIVSTRLVEGLENSSTTYNPYNFNDPNNALILAQQNAGNIDYLKQRVDELAGIKSQVDNIQQNINSMQVQVDGLVQQQADYAQQLAGSEPPEVSGTEYNEEEEQI
jgi:hypothetical protein